MRVVDGEFEPVAVHPQRKDGVLTHQVVGDQRGGIGRRGDLGKVDVFHVELLGEGGINLLLVCSAAFNEGVADAKALTLGRFEGLENIGCFDHTLIDEHFAEFLALTCHEERS